MRTYVERLSPARAATIGEWLADNAGLRRSHRRVAAARAGRCAPASSRTAPRSPGRWGTGPTRSPRGRRSRGCSTGSGCRGGSGSPTGSGSSAAGTSSSAACRRGRARRGGRRAARARTRSSAGRSLRSVGMLGVARAPHIAAHFTRRRYPGMGDAGAGRDRASSSDPAALTARHRVRAARRVVGAARRSSSGVGGLEPGRRTVALSPFDNLLCDRGTDRRAVRLRPPARDLRPGRQAALGLLRAADPPRRADRRPGRPQGRPRRRARRCSACSPSTTSRGGRRPGRWSGRSSHSPAGAAPNSAETRNGRAAPPERRRPARSRGPAFEA